MCAVTMGWKDGYRSSSSRHRTEWPVHHWDPTIRSLQHSMAKQLSPDGQGLVTVTRLLEHERLYTTARYTPPRVVLTACSPPSTLPTLVRRVLPAGSSASLLPTLVMELTPAPTRVTERAALDGARWSVRIGIVGRALHAPPLVPSRDLSRSLGHPPQRHLPPFREADVRPHRR